MSLTATAPAEFFAHVKRRPKAFTTDGSLASVAGLFIGYDAGAGLDVLRPFHAWLGARFGLPELAFFVQAEREAERTGADPGELLLDLIIEFFTETTQEP